MSTIDLLPRDEFNARLLASVMFLADPAVRSGLWTLDPRAMRYPTQAEVLKRLGDQYNKTRQTPFAARLLKSILGWRT